MVSRVQKRDGRCHCTACSELPWPPLPLSQYATDARPNIQLGWGVGGPPRGGKSEGLLKAKGASLRAFMKTGGNLIAAKLLKLGSVGAAMHAFALVRSARRCTSCRCESTSSETAWLVHSNSDHLHPHSVMGRLVFMSLCATNCEEENGAALLACSGGLYEDGPFSKRACWSLQSGE